MARHLNTTPHTPTSKTQHSSRRFSATVKPFLKAPPQPPPSPRHPLGQITASIAFPALPTPTKQPPATPTHHHLYPPSQNKHSHT
ncbi:hypothetical protein L207DRAFT_516113 [Hyaloscypha variabilis F]|uniref:Uncharacterized protein n=1 Tax=Hyaloscypha variabilis (strain UAMH 11265 / GT02V1 / F) TaxID=1149755 RepID=A0A2J6R9K3_HYAVF|nr:hypothetical protein L207DRAFT_516113 [Hyaloscypha variabilis F]